MATEQCVSPEFDIFCDDQAVFLQGNRVLGNTFPKATEDWEENVGYAMSALRSFSSAYQLVRMRALGVTGFQDLDTIEPEPNAVIFTDGFVTTNPNLVLQVNPADCGEIALHGFSKARGTEVGAIVHAGRKIVEEGGHLRVFEYICQTHNVTPADLTVWFGPSVRAPSYKFASIESAQKASHAWERYLEKKDDMWHVDVHGRTVDELVTFGVLPENMTINASDTGAPNSRYFSNRRQQTTGEPFASNGFFFALRGNQAIPRAAAPDATAAAPEVNAVD